MKTLLNILAIVAIVVGLIFTCLPLGSDPIAFLPTVPAVIFAGISVFYLTKGKQLLPKVLFAISVALLVAAGVRNITGKNVVQADTQEEQQKSEQRDEENMKDLEDLPADDAPAPEPEQK